MSKPKKNTTAAATAPASNDVTIGDSTDSTAVATAPAPATPAAPVVATVTVATAVPVAPPTPKRRGRPSKADGAQPLPTFQDVSLEDVYSILTAAKVQYVRVSRTWFSKYAVVNGSTAVSAPAPATPFVAV